jgi:hypothetical protein
VISPETESVLPGDYAGRSLRGISDAPQGCAQSATSPYVYDLFHIGRYLLDDLRFVEAADFEHDLAIRFALAGELGERDETTAGLSHGLGD